MRMALYFKHFPDYIICSVNRGRKSGNPAARLAILPKLFSA